MVLEWRAGNVLTITDYQQTLSREIEDERGRRRLTSSHLMNEIDQCLLAGTARKNSKKKSRKKNRPLMIRETK